MSSDRTRDLLKEAVVTIRNLKAELHEARRAKREPIAIVGMACRFPGAPDLDAFWSLLQRGGQALAPTPASRWSIDDYYDPAPGVAGRTYVKHGSFLDQIDGFDPEFFGIAPREAAPMDPQHRLLLEVCWEALEHAGTAPDALAGTSAGVFVGMMTPDYAFRQLRVLEQTGIDPYMLAGNELSFAAGRVSHLLGLNGPAMVITTACSSSLVALHTAAKALVDRECDVALAGGVNLIIDPGSTVMLSQLRALSPDGRCKSFDATADGYGRGEGCGVVVLRRLSDAVARGDRILAVVHGSAVNHDGASAGLTVPNGRAQEKVIRAALAAAGVDGEDLEYVEAHGTGTALGDPIELHALAAVAGESRASKLLVGSVKANIGHLEPAAGIAGVIKTVLALQHGMLPAHVIDTPTPRVSWPALPLQIVSDVTPWEGGTGLAGVSAFGLSGVNAHVVIGRGPDAPPTVGSDGACVLAISARSSEALEALVARWTARLDNCDPADWPDLCYTACVGRAHFEYRTAVAASTPAQARDALKTSPRVHVKQPAALANGHGVSEEPDRTEQMAGAVSAYLSGAAVDWHALDPRATRRIVDAPTYAFQRRSFWALPNVTAAPLRSAQKSGVAKQPPQSTREALEAQVQATLGLTAVPPVDAPLTDLGFDSLMAVELKTWARQTLGADIDLSLLLSGASIETLLAVLQTRATVTAAVPASLTSGGDEWPLSYGQRALWYVHQQAPDSTAYNVGVALRVRSRLDPARLRQSIAAVVDRHAMLRATVRGDSGAPALRILQSLDVPCEVIDASRWADGRLAREVTDAHHQPFDLEHGPLLRVSVFTQHDTSHVLLLTLHHIICDAVSCWTLLDEMQAFYAATDGSPVRLAPPGTYRDFVEWQRQYLDSEDGLRDWTFWRGRLEGELPVLNLPTDHPRPAVQTFRGGSVSVRLGAASAAIRALAKEEQATLYAALLSAFNALLHRYTGQQDVLVGSATLSRPPGFAGVVGYFANPVVVRSHVDGTQSFRALVRHVRHATLEALEHQQYPFPLLVERLQPRRDASRSPIFQADFALTRESTASRRSASSSDLDLSRFELPEEEGQFDLSLHATDLDDDIVATFKFNTDLFEESTVVKMAASFVRLVEHLALAPDTRIDEARLLSAEEEQTLVSWGTGPQVPVPQETVWERFTRQADTTPAAVAVEHATGNLTYAELRARAEAVAAGLRMRGVGQQDLVAICLDRSLDLPVAILGVMAAGAAYVPLDPGYPKVRLQFVMSDAAARCVIVNDNTIGLFEPAHTVHVDDLLSVATRHVALPQPSPDDLAYVIYTSGSTGQPKGACITHAGLMNYLHWAVDAYEVARGIGAPVNLSIGFDATVTSLFPPLLVGGRLTLIDEQAGVEGLAAALQARRGFSLVKLTPAHLEMLAELADPATYEGGTRCFVVGGEALPAALAARWRRACPSTRIVNEYGPTETVVGCCVHDVGETTRGSVPIGRPIANTTLSVKDAHDQLLPVGAIGELYIGGAGVARGYLRQPSLTTERFVGDEERLYRTGDLVRWRPDGALEFIGRMDNQVKIRGHRVEIGEVEHLLRQHPHVTEAAVVARGHGHDRHLVAYVTTSRNVTPAEVRSFLAASLPAAVLPSAIVPLDAMPLTAHGKIERAALPIPVGLESERFIAPRDALEMQLAALWESLLETGPIGVRDNFFEAGGHSLMAVRLVARLRTQFGRDIPLAAILREPTIERIADLLRQGETNSPSSLVPIQIHGRRPPFFCIPGAGGNTVYLYSLARELPTEQPFYGLQGAGFEGECEPHTSVEQMAEHYIRAIRTVQPHGPYYFGGHSLGGWVAYEMGQQLSRAGERVGLVAVIDTVAPQHAILTDRTDWDHARWVAELSERIRHLLDPTLTVSIDHLRTLTPSEQLQALKAALTRSELFPGEAGLEHLARVLKLFRAHAEITYHPKPSSRVPIALLRTPHPPGVTPPATLDHTWGWSRLGDVDVHTMSGDHLAILRPPYVGALADALTRCLTAAQHARS